MELKGVLFTNNYKKNDKAPKYRGDVEIDGTKHKIAGWEKTTKNGDPYISFSLDTYVKPGDTAQNQPAINDMGFQDTKASQPTTNDDLPF
jgi:hypothetical protein